MLILLVSISVSCSEEDCDGQTYEALCLDDMGCANTLYQLQLMSTNDFELIQNQEEYLSMIEGNCQPEIDWKIYDLVVGTESLTNGIAGISKTYRMDCTTNQLNLTVNIQLNLTTLAPTITWSSLIPKLKDNESLFVSVNVLN